MFKYACLRTLGLASVCVNNIAEHIKKKSVLTEESSELDKTGRCTSMAYPINVVWNKDGILFADYQHSFAHSLWRSQEFSLFMKHKNMLQFPILDFGCGDGSFASVLFDSIDYGVDYDKEALDIAKNYHLYTKLGISINDLALPPGTVKSVFSNSVLEHVADIKKIVDDIYRILVRRGIFIFTVPTIQFKEDLTKYFGAEESEKINKHFYHRNLKSVNEWADLLNIYGFSIVRIIHYQPAWFTFIYRILNTSGIGKICLKFRKFFWITFSNQIIAMLKKSINTNRVGANIFVIAKKEF